MDKQGRWRYKTLANVVAATALAASATAAHAMSFAFGDDSEWNLDLGYKYRLYRAIASSETGR